VPAKDCNIGIKGIGVCSSRFKAGTIRSVAKLRLKPSCPRCAARGKSLRLKQRFERKLQHESWGEKLHFFTINVPKYHCRRCGKYFRQSIPGVAPYQRSSERLQKQVARMHKLGLSKKDAGVVFGRSHSTVEKYYRRFNFLLAQERKGKLCPKVLGIDEHFFNKRSGYVTTMVDLKSHRVFDLLKGRSAKSVERALLRLKGRERVQVVVMDLSSTYRSIVKQFFPNAMIVADRFHVVRLINLQLMKVWKRLDERGRKNRALVSLIRRNCENLSDKQKHNLARYFDDNPALGMCYKQLKALQRLLSFKGMNRKTVKRKLIPKLLSFITLLEQTPFEELLTLAQTLKSWIEPIARMWRFRKTNSITEGLHNKMELIQRRAYGFHSFENYRIRVIALCG